MKLKLLGSCGTCFPEEKADMAFGSTKLWGFNDLAGIAISFPIPLRLIHDEQLAA